MKAGGFVVPDGATVQGVNLEALGLSGSQGERLGSGQTAKYGNRRIGIDGYTFDSEKEAKRYRILAPLAQVGCISEFEVHPLYRLEVNGILIARYRPDFRYRLEGALVVEDVKSEPTRKKYSYRLKVKLMLALYDITIREV